MQSRVGELDLLVRTSSERADAIVTAARAFTCRVLERCDALLEHHAPGRLVFMRELEMEWRVWEHALDSADEVEAVAEEIARAVDQDVRSGAPTLDGSNVVAVFVDEAQYRALYLRALAAGAEPAWFFAPLVGEGPAPGVLDRREHRPLTEAVVTRLALEGVLEDVLSTLPKPAVMRLAEALDVFAPSPAAEGEHAWSPAQRALAACIRARPNTTRANRADDVDDDASSSREIPQRLISSLTGPEDAVEVVDTRFGGLFYLLPLALELSIGEALWTACVSEHVCFTRIAEAIAGVDAASDPAPRIFGGASAVATLAPVTAEQQAEVASRLLDSFVTALGRRSPAGVPEIHLTVVSVAQRRLLVATAPPSGFVVFAWPAESASELREGFAAFLAHWPAGAPRVSAAAALSSLDRSGRIKPASTVHGRPWIVEQADDLFATALLTQTAGSLALLFATRTHDPSLTAPLLTARYFTIPARIVIASETIDIAMPMDRIDLAVRMAGLDRNPGWVPWLQRRVRVVFEECNARPPGTSTDE